MHRARDIGLCREVMPLVERRGFYYSLATSAGIVLGLLVLRTAFASEYSIAAEFVSNRLTYVYVFVATAVVFMVLGYILGRQADELRRLSTTDALTGLSNSTASTSGSARGVEFAIIAPNTAGTAAHRLGQRLLCS